MKIHQLNDTFVTPFLAQEHIKPVFFKTWWRVNPWNVRLALKIEEVRNATDMALRKTTDHDIDLYKHIAVYNILQQQSIVR